MPEKNKAHRTNKGNIRRKTDGIQNKKKIDLAEGRMEFSPADHCAASGGKQPNSNCENEDQLNAIGCDIELPQQNELAQYADKSK